MRPASAPAPLLPPRLRQPLRPLLVVSTSALAALVVLGGAGCDGDEASALDASPPGPSDAGAGADADADDARGAPPCETDAPAACDETFCVVAAGCFRMGSPEAEACRGEDET